MLNFIPSIPRNTAIQSGSSSARGTRWLNESSSPQRSADGGDGGELSKLSSNLPYLSNRAAAPPLFSRRASRDVGGGPRQSWWGGAAVQEAKEGRDEF